MPKFYLLKKNLQAYWLIWLISLKKMLSFKLSFWSQSIFMFISNSLKLGIWWLLYERFGEINGYGFEETLLIHGFLSLWFAILFIFFEGVLSLGEIIRQDGFLNLQLYPVSPMVLLLNLNPSPNKYGDLIFRIVFTAIAAVNLELNLLLIIISAILAAMGIFGIFLIGSCLIFFNEGFLNLPSVLFQFFVGAGFYPSENFRGINRLVLIIIGIVPVVFIPLEVARNFFPIGYLGITLGVAICTNFVGFKLWQVGVRRVESGSSRGLD